MCWRGGHLLHRITETQALQPKRIIFQHLRVIYQIPSTKPIMEEKECGESHILFLKVEAWEWLYHVYHDPLT